MDKKFSTGDVMRMLKIPRDRLRAWMDLGFINPAFPSSGQGSKALFTADNICKIVVFNALVTGGLSRKFASECLSLRSDSDIRKLLAGGARWFVVNIEIEFDGELLAGWGIK